MFMLFLQSLIWLMLATLLGALVGWFIRPYFCRDCEQETNARDNKHAYTANSGHDASKAHTTAANINTDSNQQAHTEANADTPHASATETGFKTAAAATAAGIAALAGGQVKQDRDTAEATRKAEEARQAAETEAARQAAEAEAARKAEEARKATDEVEAAHKATEAARQAEDAEAVPEAETARQAAKAEASARQTAAADVAAAATAAVAAPASSGNTAQQTVTQAAAYEEDVSDAMRPAGLAVPQEGKADDLKQIKGIGPAIEKTLNAQGIYHFHQIADFDDANVRWVNHHISFPGRIQREDWIGQAKALANKQTYEGYAYDPATVNVTDDMRPERLANPEHGQADDLQRIKGIGPVIERTLNNEGVYHYRQIAAFTPRNTMWVDQHIAFPGRVHREDWIGQAKSLMAGQEYSGHGLQAVAEAEASAGGANNDAPINESMRPKRASLAPNTQGDDLQVIKGIGPVIEESLHAEGIYYYQQIAEFDDDNVRWVNNHMAFPGRIEREDWIGQAKKLVGQQSISSNDASASASASAFSLAGGRTEGGSPILLNAAINGEPDDLKRIKGVGFALERALNNLGIYHYQQIADMTPENIEWVDDNIPLPGKVVRKHWVKQAKALAEGQATLYSNRFDDGKTPYQ